MCEEKTRRTKVVYLVSVWILTVSGIKVHSYTNCKWKVCLDFTNCKDIIDKKVLYLPGEQSRRAYRFGDPLVLQGHPPPSARSSRRTFGCWKISFLIVFIRGSKNWKKETFFQTWLEKFAHPAGSEDILRGGKDSRKSK